MPVGVGCPTVKIDGVEIEYGAEETTNLPLEIQPALDDLSRIGRVRKDHRAIELVLREAPDGRFEPYRDFSEPRRKAMANPRNRIHGGRNIRREDLRRFGMTMPRWLVLSQLAVRDGQSIGDLARATVTMKGSFQRTAWLVPSSTKRPSPSR